MKEIFETVKLEFINLREEDIIKTSPPDSGNPAGGEEEAYFVALSKLTAEKTKGTHLGAFGFSVQL